jgi:hypothetical protein
MWSDRHVLDSLLWEAAVDDMGIYPKSTIRAGVETHRTEWQDGWNAALMEVTKRHGEFTSWVKTLTAEQIAQIREMLDADGEPIALHYGETGVSLSLFCSDTFMYACADGEDFALADLPEIHRLWKAHGYLGTIAWVARKRQAEPVKEYRYDAGYLKAKADLV